MSAIRPFDPERVRPLPKQPRKRFAGIPQLAASIKAVGQLTPGIVTIVADDPAYDAQLVDGERRLRACKLAGVKFRAEVRDDAAYAKIFASSVAANFHRQAHDAIETAEALGAMRENHTVEEISTILGKSEPWIYQHLNLLKLHEDVKQLMVPEEEGESAPLSYQTAQLLIPVPIEKQPKLAKRILGLPAAAARRLILAARAKDGDAKAYTPTGGRKKTVLGIRSVIDTVNDRLAIYCEMPGAEFGKMLTDSPRGDVEQLEALVDDLIDTLQQIKKPLTRRLK